jgi:hypothetical protein
LVTNMVKEEFNAIVLPDRDSLISHWLFGIPSRQEISMFHGRGEYIFLTFGFKDVVSVFLIFMPKERPPSKHRQ